MSGDSATGYLAATSDGSDLHLRQHRGSGELGGSRPARERWRSTSRSCSTPSARPTTRWSACRSGARSTRRWPSGSTRCASTRACRALRYDNGVTSYLEVLYAENELFGAELNAVAALSGATPNWSTCTRRWAAAGSIWPIRWRHSRSRLPPQAHPGCCARCRRRLPPQLPRRPTAAAAAAAGQDRTAVVQEGKTSVLNVYRERGIGGVEVRAPKTGWPPAAGRAFSWFPRAWRASPRELRRLPCCARPSVPRAGLPKTCAPSTATRVEAVRKSGDLYEVTLPASMLTSATARSNCAGSINGVDGRSHRVLSSGARRCPAELSNLGWNRQYRSSRCGRSALSLQRCYS